MEKPFISTASFFEEELMCICLIIRSRARFEACFFNFCNPPFSSSRSMWLSLFRSKHAKSPLSCSACVFEQSLSFVNVSGKKGRQLSSREISSTSCAYSLTRQQHRRAPMQFVVCYVFLLYSSNCPSANKQTHVKKQDKVCGEVKKKQVWGKWQRSNNYDKGAKRSWKRETTKEDFN